MVKLGRMYKRMWLCCMLTYWVFINVGQFPILAIFTNYMCCSPVRLLLRFPDGVFIFYQISNIPRIQYNIFSKSLLIGLFVLWIME